MPMYDFVCTACAHKFEDIVSGDEVPSCPRCGSATQRQMSAPSPLKTGAFPYKPGPVRPIGQGMPPTCGSEGCGGTCGFSGGSQN